MSNFLPLEFVGRGSLTQLQVVENLNKLTSSSRVKKWRYVRTALLREVLRALRSVLNTD